MTKVAFPRVAFIFSNWVGGQECIMGCVIVEKLEAKFG